MSKFKAGQTYRTRNQSIARIYAVDDTLRGLIHGAVASGDGWDAIQWEKNGKFFFNKSDSEWDLMPETEYFYCVAYLITKETPMIKSFNSEKERDQFTSTLVGEFKTFELEKI